MSGANTCSVVERSDLFLDWKIRNQPSEFDLVSQPIDGSVIMKQARPSGA